jgi:ribosomal protein S18 acetylase RimI-like enzyme
MRVLNTVMHPLSESITVRRELRPGDTEAIAAMHGEVYRGEFALGPTFVTDIERNLAAAVEAGWPERGSLWLVELDGSLVGSMALTEESPGVACLRWVLLRSELRATGLGRRLVTEAVEEADDAGYDLLYLETFSELQYAARIYRRLGFEVTKTREDDRWGRQLLLQRYERRRA